MGVMGVNALAERAGSSQGAKMRQLEELLARRDQLDKKIEDGFSFGFRTIDQISTGWDEFYRIENQIKDTKLIICKYSQVLLGLYCFYL